MSVTQRYGVVRVGLRAHICLRGRRPVAVAAVPGCGESVSGAGMSPCAADGRNGEAALASSRRRRSRHRAVKVRGGRIVAGLLVPSGPGSAAPQLRAETCPDPASDTA